MPYNTRRKSLSLSELGIIVPKRSRTQSHPTHPTPPSTIVEGDEPPAKKTKRSHGSSSNLSGMMSPPRTTTIRTKEDKSRKAAQLSPPPSPGADTIHKVDSEGINDEIVVAAIRQLEQTGNRPHLVKELAAILATNLHSIEKCDLSTQQNLEHCANTLDRSANPCALISSRLTAYLNRHWPTVSPCPLAKDLSPVHPRRLYFYLTTTPHQPIPETVEAPPKPVRIISPSLSSASAADEGEDERLNRQRTALSPSPEVDLSSPELEDENAEERPPTPGAPFSGRNSMSRDRSMSASNLNRNRRAASPQLEHEERDFKQTASALQAQRRNSQQSQQQQNKQEQSQQQDVKMEGDGDTTAGAEQPATAMVIEESEEALALKNSQAAADLFFGSAEHLKPWAQEMEFSSPIIEPKSQGENSIASSIEMNEAPLTLDMDALREKDTSMLGDWDALQSPESIDVAELEDMFDAY